jgi:hypothetical protein
MDYQISSLDAATFGHLFGQDKLSLDKQNVRRMTVTEKPGFPCRVTLEDADVGDSVLLLNYEHQPASSPYRSSHAIFVNEGATGAASYDNEIPLQLQIRNLSVRSFDAAGMMVDADTCSGEDLEAMICRLFADATADYIHVHTAARGCYLARVDRASSP